MTKEDELKVELSRIEMYYGKTWYCVEETYYDDGLVTASIVNVVRSIKQPEDHLNSTPNTDVYSTWYDSIEAAKEAVDNALAESRDYL